MSLRHRRECGGEVPAPCGALLVCRKSTLFPYGGTGRRVRCSLSRGGCCGALESGIVQELLVLITGMIASCKGGHVHGGPQGHRRGWMLKPAEVLRMERRPSYMAQCVVPGTNVRGERRLTRRSEDLRAAGSCSVPSARPPLIAEDGSRRLPWAGDHSRPPSELSVRACRCCLKPGRASSLLC